MRRRLSNLLRDDEKRFHSSVSVVLSRRGAAFHSSKRTLSRSLVDFQLSDSASDSASATNFSLTIKDAARFASRTADSISLRS